MNEKNPINRSVKFIFLSCVSIRFPESIKVDITVPENLNLEKVQVIIDTLKGVSRKGKNIDAVMEFNIVKKDN